MQTSKNSQSHKSKLDKIMTNVEHHQTEYKQVLLHYTEKNFAPTQVMDLRKTILIDGVFKHHEVEKIEKPEGNMLIRPRPSSC